MSLLAFNRAVHSEISNPKCSVEAWQEVSLRRSVPQRIHVLLFVYLFIFDYPLFWGPLGPLGRSGRAGITSIYSGRAFREACQPGRWLMSDSLGAAADNPSGEWWRAELGRRRQAFHFLMFLMACRPWRVIPQSVLFLYKSLPDEIICSLSSDTDKHNSEPCWQFSSYALWYRFNVI